MFGYYSFMLKKTKALFVGKMSVGQVNCWFIIFNSISTTLNLQFMVIVLFSGRFFLTT